ncbi:hypothetical protein SASPL_149617 [Salvia splendens]|uniref:S-locus glycoprotein domain-containing protein n=1 Tax=Salvia splendens TaxID=180675 RepID=A0A8X8Z4U4_SALSN|nr:hypothetical protein SASPL_149617 [Salvia splendens]
MDQNNSQYIMRRESEQYWASGVPEMRRAIRQGYRFTYVDNENESYYSYMICDPSFMARQFLDVTGQLKQQMWTESGWLGYWFRLRFRLIVGSLVCAVSPHCQSVVVWRDSSIGLKVSWCWSGLLRGGVGRHVSSGGCTVEEVETRVGKEVSDRAGNSSMRSAGTASFTVIFLSQGGREISAWQSSLVVTSAGWGARN